MQGKVKWFGQQKGYGFITAEDGRTDYYYHVSNVQGADLPSIGDKVTFTPSSGPKGLVAKEVCMASREPAASGKHFCHACHHTVMPRVVVSHGEATHSVCPICGEVIRIFGSSGALLDLVSDWYWSFFIWLNKVFGRGK